MAEKFSTILLDTSIYEQYGLRLEKGLLGKLSQFSRIDAKFILPDVIYNEVKKHLEKKIKASRGALEKALDEAGDHLFFDGSELNDAKSMLIDGKEIEDLGKNRLDKFIDVTGATVLKTGEYVSVSDLLECYFDSTPPFADSGKKKNEFPDAIILMAVEAWAEENDENVIAVSKDEDWRKFCEDKDSIHFVDDLSLALVSFNKETAPYQLIENLEYALNEGKAGKFLQDIAGHLDTIFSGFTPDQEADSNFFWEAEGSCGGFNDFDFLDYKFTVIDKNDDWVVLEAYAEINLHAEGEFTLSMYDSIDKDHIFMGSITKEAEADYETKLLITVSGDLSGSIDDLIVEDVEVVDIPTSMDFGELELDYEPDEDNY